MQLYADKFEGNRIMYFHDMWEYIERKLSEPDGAVRIVHPNDPVQHASAPRPGGVLAGHGASQQPHLYVKQANELDQMSKFASDLQVLIEDEYTPAWVKQQAKLQQTFLELYPI